MRTAVSASAARSLVPCRLISASFDATQARFSTGLASLFDLEDARRTLFVSQTSRVSLQRERAEAWVALYRAMGGGWTRPESLALRSSTASPSP